MRAEEFNGRLKQGQIGESKVAKWLKNRGHMLLVLCDGEMDKAAHSGPKILTSTRNFVAPDLASLKDGEMQFFEVKSKSVFTWHGKTRQFRTGLAVRLFEEYWAIRKEAKKLLYLTFLHESSQTHVRDVQKWGAPAECPTGLFFEEIGVLYGEYLYARLRSGTVTPYCHIHPNEHGILHVYFSADLLKSISLSTFYAELDAPALAS